MGLVLGIDITSSRSAAAWSIVNGDGVSGSASIAYAGGDEWTITNSGTPSGPWTVTTAQLATGYPILLAAQVVTTAAGPIYSVTAGANDPLFLCPSGDLAYYVYEWDRSGSTVGTGRTYNASGDSGLLVESVITAYNNATGGVTGVESRVTAQAAATEVTPVQFTNQKLINAATVPANTSVSFVITFETPATIAAQYMWHGQSALSNPRIFYSALGALTAQLQSNPSTTIVGATKYTLFASYGSSGRKMFLQQGASITTVENVGTSSSVIAVTKNMIGNADGTGYQFTGRMWRMYRASHFLDFSNSAIRQLFTDSAGLVVNPPTGQAAAATYDFDFYTPARWEAGTNGGLFGNFTKSGSAF